MPTRAVGRAWRGVVASVRARPLTVASIALGVFVLDVVLPPLVLSLARTPWTFFTFNPWLKSLPAYLVSPAPVAQKLDFLSRVAVFWVSADGPYGAPEWGFAVDALDLLRFLAMGGLIGLYFALWLRARESGRDHGARPRPGPAGGVVGAVVGAVALSTGPCSVVGCGAPVLPVVGLVFAGLSSGTIALLSSLSRVVGLAVLIVLVVAVAYLGWRVGPPATPRARRATAPA